MRITDVGAILLSCPLPQPFSLPFWGGIRRILKRDALLIRIDTDTGLVGVAPGPAHTRARDLINGSIRAMLLGKDPLQWVSFAIEKDWGWEKIYRSVEIALLDLVGQYEGCPVSELIGGKCRSSIKLYGSAGMYMSAEGYAAEAAAIRDEGFAAYKMRPAAGPDEDLRTVELMRSATADDFGLMIDAHTWWRMGNLNYETAVVHHTAQAMAQFDPVWLEEPLPPDDHDGYVSLTHKRFVPIASGEHEQDLHGFEDLIHRQAVNYLQADVCCQGGFGLGSHIFDFLAGTGIRFAFHCWGTSLEVLASAHLGVCWPEEIVEWLEYPCYQQPGRAGMYPFPLANDMLTEPLEISNGHLVLSDRSGLGTGVDWSIVDRYPFIPGPWSYFDQESPRQTIAVTGDHSIQWVPENHSG